MQLAQFGCSPLAEVDPQALAVTYWVDAAPSGAPYSLDLRIVGRRVGAARKPEPGDSFDVHTSVPRVVPGMGRLAVTTRILDVTPGDWRVTVAPVADRSRPGPRLAGSSADGSTGWAPAMQVLAPGVRLGAWPVLVVVGAAAALSVQALLAVHLGLSVIRLFGVSLVACLLGVAGAKVYYLAWHREARRAPLRAGMCIQGFVLAAIAGLVAGSYLTGVDVGAALDVSVAGLMLGMVIGRFGCFLGGCCAGRLTASRWGLWSSDRRLGARRVPTQLLEAGLAAAIAAAAWIAIWAGRPHPAGTVFVAAVAAYTLGRQLLFPLRDVPRQTLHGRTITLILAAVVLVAAVAVVVS